MKHPNESFNQIFEQYLFRMATAYIDLAKPACQTDLIHLLTKGKQAGVSTTPAKDYGVATEWNQVLEAPINWQLVDAQWLMSIRQAQ